MEITLVLYGEVTIANELVNSGDIMYTHIESVIESGWQPLELGDNGIYQYTINTNDKLWCGGVETTINVGDTFMLKLGVFSVTGYVYIKQIPIIVTNTVSTQPTIDTNIILTDDDRIYNGKGNN